MSSPINSLMESTYPNPWMFNGKPFESDDIGEFEGFVYLIEKCDGSVKYIGRKYFSKIRKVKGKGRRVRSESDWKRYWSSSDDLKALVKKDGKDSFRRTIVSLHITQGDTNYCEVKEQFIRNVLEDDTYINENISGKYHRKKPHIVEARMINPRQSPIPLHGRSLPCRTDSIQASGLPHDVSRS